MSLLIPIIFMPLLMSVLQLFFGKNIKGFHIITIVAGVGVSWLLSVKLLLGVVFFHDDPSQLTVLFNWAHVFTGNFRIGFMADGMTVLMLPMVSTVSLLVHIFASGYMHGHERYSRFFAQISFFTFAMLALVTSNNLLFFFMAWELMGLCSYLLIGFYYEQESAFKAAIKAFLTTRVGDVIFFLGIAILYSATGELSFDGITEMAHHGQISHTALLTASLCFLGGAIGKSAQFPLHVWLP
ncbi:MAG: NADH-quinone oxidoreductase subunit L, partial [Candidatus Lindowbacteria bacterium]|nr:NADH-quinone oxidoreductase subunit L [Candidatus Lindowbacteria bacterium]